MKKTVVLGLLVILLSFEFTGCDDDPTNIEGGRSGKSITITEITGTAAGTVFIYLSYSKYPDNEVAAGRGTISENSVTIPLMQFTNNTITLIPWNVSGSFYIKLSLFKGSEHINSYVYGESYTDMQKYDISSTTSSIAFSNFAMI